MQFVLILMLHQVEEEKIHCSRMLRILLYLIPIGNVAGIDGVFSLPGLPFLPCYHAWKMQEVSQQDHGICVAVLWQLLHFCPWILACAL